MRLFIFVVLFFYSCSFGGSDNKEKTFLPEVKTGAGSVSVKVEGVADLENMKAFDLSVYKQNGEKIAETPVNQQGTFALDMTSGKDLMFEVKGKNGKKLRSYVSEIAGDVSDIKINARTSAVVYAMEAKMKTSDDNLKQMSQTIEKDESFPALLASVKADMASESTNYPGEFTKKIAQAVALQEPILTNMEIVPEEMVLEFDDILDPLQVLGLYSNGKKIDVTGKVSFGSSDEDIVAVKPKGELLLNGDGSAIITASLDGLETTSFVKIKEAVMVGIEIVPAEANMFPTDEKNFEVLAVYSDKSRKKAKNAIWTSADLSVAKVDTYGKAISQAKGRTYIIAELLDFTARAVLAVNEAKPVKIEIVADDFNIKQDSNRQLQAVLEYADGKKIDVTLEAKWSSENMDVAVISNAFGCNGLAIGVASGTTTITVEIDGLKASKKVKVSAEYADIR